ncbi:FG-GAP-like repeat-containing protein [Aquiflexum sp. TKW24L]|uniref:FG-GAP-like repeat-containing protein n=1 Tax=Aquiflexum sp. TKW24L TaxID=2942212 RepID=UPI0020BE6F32|nr:FG-GAP-like repeat-containing protein [Aquiflexum sp. TKW24L]MCL6261034.1 FG-GAP-like repeat-containing protein [Aquiflexum sp. TKW24L]
MKSYYYLGAFLLLSIASCTKKEDTLFNLLSMKDTGIDFNNLIVESDSFNILTDEYIFNGGGVAVGDFNNDGLPDLFFTGNQVANKLYLNEGKLKFKDVSTVSGIEAKDRWSTGVTVVDINGDGLLDVYVCAAMFKENEKRANMLFVNQGLNKDGIPTFIESAAQYGIAGTDNSMMATFFDYNNDGLLDLYVLNNEQSKSIPSNYREKIADGSAINNDRLYRNNGNGTFTDVTIEAGITIEGFGLGLAVADLNGDGWSDLYISNDYTTNDILYINNQDGTFSNQSKTFLRHQSMFSMGSDISDYNNDGFPDIVTLDMLGETNFRKKTTISKNSYQTYISNEQWGYEYQHVRNMLHVGNGPNIPFSEIGFMAGMYQTDWSWSPLFVDMDNDGNRDLLITNGFPRDITDKDFANYRADVGGVASIRQLLDSIPIIKIPNYSYRNQGDWTFENVGHTWGLNKSSFSNGAAYVDLDQDGDLDYVVNNINDPAFVFENTLNTRDSKPNYFRVKLQGSKNNSFGIGAKVVLRFGQDKFQYHEQQLSRGYLSAVEDIVHFGLDTINEISSLEILWPDGRYEKTDHLHANQVIELKHANASPKPGDLQFPLGPKTVTPLVEEISGHLGINFIHQEMDKIDYNVQRTLPHKLTQFGPSLAVGDLNGDGLEDFIIGSASGYSPVVNLQQSDGTFSSKEMFATDIEKSFEEMGMLLFDLDNDGDLDLYLVSGSSEFLPDAAEYQDRIYINDGKGNFAEQKESIPAFKSSGTVVRAADFDGDGFVELFVGGRTPIAQYPLPDQSLILKNNQGRLEDVTDIVAPGLRRIGMVTDALWTDVDGDGRPDLMVAGELMPITVFLNKGSKLQKMTDSGLENHLGWWNSLVAGDFDGDGDIDYVVGNMGANNYYHPTMDRPVKIYAKDFDNNKSIDPVTITYFKDNENKYIPVPAHYWDDLYGQSTLFRRKFERYKQYARITEADLFTAEELEGVTILQGNYDRSSYIENLGNGKFKIHELPLMAQIAPVNGMAVDDINGDGNLDVLLVGNDYGNEVFSGRYDSMTGLVLLGDGKGGFEAVRSLESGFLVPGDAKSMAVLTMADGKNIYLSTQNRSTMKVHAPLKASPGKVFKVPAGIHTLVLELENGKTRKIEVFNRSGFLSNLGSTISLPANVKSLKGIDYKGGVVEVEF